MCPISLDLFKDPVTLWTGQTYDRSCIERWLAAGNSTCPVTMQKLKDSSMVPNHTLRHLIHQWLNSNGYSEADDLSENQTYVDRIKHIIESDAFEPETKIRALEEVRSLSQELPVENSCLIKLDLFKILVEQVFGKPRRLDLQESLVFVEIALSCALKLMPYSELRCLNFLKQEPEYTVFVSLIENGTVSIKRSLCLVVEAISSEVQTNELYVKLGRSARTVCAIIRIVEQSKSEGLEAGIRALAALSSTDSNRESMARNGVVEGLIACLSSVKGEDRSFAAMAMAANENLLSETRAKEVIVNHPEGVREVVKMVFRVSEHEGSASAVNSLLVLCSESESAREKAIVDGVLTQLLLLLQSQSNARTKTKARLLLKLLRSN